MNVLIGCEFSGIVRDAFTARGHNAVSCDLLPCERPGKHIQGNLLEVLGEGWDRAIFFPPCTDLAVSGAKHFAAKRADGRQQAALEFVQKLMDSPIPSWGLENPISIISTKIRKPDQIIQPWMFGHPESKATCLWLKNLPKLVETNNVREEMMKLPINERNRVHYMSPGPDRWRERSRTFRGIADAFAAQWG